MKISLKKIFAVLICTLVAVGCDSASNNDQGTSFTSAGYRVVQQQQQGAGGAGGQQQNLGVSVLSDTLQTIGQLTREIAGFQQVGGGGGQNQEVPIGIVLQNRLSEQFITVNSINCDYTVPGSTLAPVSDSIAVGGVIAPTAVEEGDGTVEFFDTVAEPSEETIAFSIFTPQFGEYLNANFNRLPDFPFNAIASCYAVGTTQSGDVLLTNRSAITTRIFE